MTLHKKCNSLCERPPALAAKPLALVPLYQGDSKLIKPLSPLKRGRRERSERGGQLRRVSLSISFFLSLCASAGYAAAPGAAAQKAVIDQYCVTCHNDRAKTAGLSLQGLDPARAHDDAETWEKVIRKLGAGLMPPPGARRPERATLDGL